MVKTNPTTNDTAGRSSSTGSAILLAALALPGVHAALADTPPERAEISYRFMDYQDFQAGWDRIGVRANAVAVEAPFAGDWSVGGSLTRDMVSGASPAYRSEKLLAGQMEEKRWGRDVHVARFFPRGSLRVGITDSQESDYTSRGFSVAGSISTESKNTTLNVGLGTSHDRVDVKRAGITQESKDTDELMLGITQVLSTVDIVQMNYTRSQGEGFYSDPYKLRDKRPRNKDQQAYQLRWNHHFRPLDGTAQFSYRWYRDSFGISAHTLGLEYVQRLPHAWTVTPILRLYTQSAADFYLEAFNPPFPTIRPLSRIQTQDQRMASFGALTFGLKIGKEITPDLTADIQIERYEQRTGWTAFGSESTAIEPFKATMFQIGFSHYF